MKLLLVLLLSIGFQSSANAKELDNSSQEALEKTKALLTDSEKRSAAVNENGSSKAADDYARKLGTDTDGVYDLSAEIMETIVKRTNGDVTKMKELIDEASRDPAAFANSLSQAEKDQIKALAAPIKQKDGQKP